MTDNAYNIVGAVKMNKSLTHIPCFAHCLHLVVENAMKVSLNIFMTYILFDILKISTKDTGLNAFDRKSNQKK